MHKFLIDVRRYVRPEYGHTPERNAKPAQYKLIHSVGKAEFAGTRFGYSGRLTGTTEAEQQAQVDAIRAKMDEHAKLFRKLKLQVKLEHHAPSGGIRISIQGPELFHRKHATQMDVTWNTGKNYKEAPAWKNHINKK